MSETDSARVARKFSQPQHAMAPQMWAGATVNSSHEDALYAFGELGMFTLMWREPDFEAGLVGRCQTCFGAGSKTSRQAAAFDQPNRRECPDCYGTTYEGGIRAQIVRPLIMADRQSIIQEATEGVVTTDSIQFETTSDFTFTLGDYLFRFDGTRYQCEQRNEVIIRTGFDAPLPVESLTGIAVAHLEAPTTVAYKIPPTDPAVLQEILDRNFVIEEDLSVFETISPNGYLVQGIPEPAHPGPTSGNVIYGEGPPDPNLEVPEGTEYIDLLTGDVYEGSG